MSHLASSTYSALFACYIFAFSSDQSKNEVKVGKKGSKKRILAASAATKEEEQARVEVFEDGSKPVHPDKRVWRPRVQSDYIEPDTWEDELHHLDLLFGDYGKSLAIDKHEVPPRADGSVIKFDEEKHGSELSRNLQWRNCPKEHQASVKNLILRYWDVFAEEGIRYHIRGFEFHIDTGACKPVCCKAREYGAHESRVITKLVEKLEDNGLCEDDDGPWGARVVLASKPNQGHVHWFDFAWRLCVSYRQLNAVTRPFTFPAPRCDYSIQDLGPTKYQIVMDMATGYWQMKMTESSKPKTAFFVPDGKKRFTVMPMGVTNAHPVFVAFAVYLKKKWTKMAIEKGLDPRNFDSKVIVDDIILAASNVVAVLLLFQMALEVLQLHRVTLQLRKCRFLEPYAEFVGFDMMLEGNAPAQSKFENFRRLAKPHLFGDLRTLIGVFGFYRNFLEWFEVRVSPWRKILKSAPKPGSASIDQEAECLNRLWTKDDEKLLEQFKTEIVVHPIVGRPDLNKRFYVKTDWSRLAYGAALCQPSDDPEDIEAMKREVQRGPCEFDMTVDGKRLVPLILIDRTTTEREKHDHSSIGEAKVGFWAFPKFHRYLFGAEFTWICDASSLQKFLDNVDEPSHQFQRIRMQLLRYSCTIVARPGSMMVEVDAMSRYNRVYDQWLKEQKGRSVDAGLLYRYNKRAEELRNVEDNNVTMGDRQMVSGKKLIEKDKPKGKKEASALWAPVRNLRPIDCTLLAPEVRGGKNCERTELAEVVDRDRSVWILGLPMTVEAAMVDLGMDLNLVQRIVFDTPLKFGQWKSRDSLTVNKAIELLRDEQRLQIDWLFLLPTSKSNEMEQALCLLSMAIHRAIKAICLFDPSVGADSEVDELIDEGRHWIKLRDVASNKTCGGFIQDERQVLVLLPKMTTRHWRGIPKQAATTAMALSEILDDDMVPLKFQPRLFGNAELLPQERNDFVSFQADRMKVPPAASEPYLARKAMTGKLCTEANGIQEAVVYDVQFPAPTANPEFLICLPNRIHGSGVRPIKASELCRAAGFLEDDIVELSELYSDSQLRRWALKVPSSDMLQELMAELLRVEDEERDAALEGLCTIDSSDEEEPYSWCEDRNRFKGLMAQNLNRRTTLPLPTLEEWRAAVSSDQDLSKVKRALEDDTLLLRADLSQKSYHDEWLRGSLEIENGVVYQYEEPRKAKVRQLRRKVVPLALRRTIVTAYHVAPIAGHVGFHKTYYRIAVRFWWPSMSADVRFNVIGCAACKLSNSASHENQKVLSALSCDQPFDVVTMDIWEPGYVIEKSKKVTGRKLVTHLDNMTGFAAIALIGDATSIEVSKAVFMNFFVPNGLPRMVMIDDGSAFKSVMVAMCEHLGIVYHVVARENHDAILCERFHRYLNKVERIHTADTDSFSDWILGAGFATYAWNASPIDGTDVTRSFVARGRDFPFPLDVLSSSEENPSRVPPIEGQAALEHVETMFPLWTRQKELLAILNEERRERHRVLKNQARTQRLFNPGDLVIVRRQVKSQAKEGVMAKLLFKARGPYRVLNRVDEDSYMIQKLPAIQGTGRRTGKPRKEAAMRLEKIPSSIVLHKRIDGMDTRLASIHQPLSHTPLSNELGLFQFGQYDKASPNEKFAFVRLQEMWQEEISESEASIDSDSSDDDGGGNENDDQLEATASEAAESGSEAVVENVVARSESVKPPTIRVDRKARRESRKTVVRKRKRSSKRDDSVQLTRASKRSHRLPERFRDEKGENVVESVTTAVVLRNLWRRVRASKDKLFFIKRQLYGEQQARWYLVQVDLDETDPQSALQFGRYHCKWHVRHADDSLKVKTRFARFWPEIHLVRDGVLAEMVPVRPNKVANLLGGKKTGSRYAWYCDEVDLAEDQLVGPFDFKTATLKDNRLNLIDQACWSELLKFSETVDTSTIDAIDPLK